MENIKLANINLYVLGILLVGYAFLNKSFAYIGYSPVYIGEVGLATTLFILFASNPSFTWLRSPIIWAVLAYVIWQVVVLAAAGPKIDINALRDSAVWYYSIFAVVTSAVLLQSRSVDRAIDWYARWIPWLIIWAPIGFLIQVMVGKAMPRFPGQEFGLLVVKPGDLQVHLAGAITFLMLGLHRIYPRAARQSFRYMEHICWAFLMFGMIALGSRTRAGLLSIVAAVAVVTLFRPRNRLMQFLVPALFVFSLFAVLDIHIPLPSGREISTSQITSNIESILGFGDNRGTGANLQGTADWRLEWWQTIIDETIGGRFFWTGRGYGPHLADLHGFSDATRNRSPHNGHLTVLARSGLPGLVLWAILIITTYVTLLRRYLVASHANDNIGAKVDLWVLGYLTAFFVNMSFDVFLEGPQGGIWFWCLLGFVIALTQTQRATAARRTAAQLGTVRQVARP